MTDSIEDVVHAKEERSGLESEVEDPEEKKVPVAKHLYHLITGAPLAYLSYAVAGVSGLFFSSFLTLGGIAKRRKLGKRYSGEKTYKDLKAGSAFGPLVYGLYKFVNLFTDPLVRTAALNPVSYAVFNGAYLAYTYMRDTVRGSALAKSVLDGNFLSYVRQTWREELKPNWRKLNLKTLIFLPVNYFNVNVVKGLAPQIFMGSLVDFAYGIFTTGRGEKKGSRENSSNYQKSDLHLAPQYSAV